MFGFFRARRRRKLLSEPFPPHWEAVLKRNVGHYPRLSEPERATLRDITRVLIAERGWEGRGGFHVTDEVKVTVAAQAALLLLGLPEHNFFGHVPVVLVFPDAVQSPNPQDDYEDDNLSETLRDGEAWQYGPVILGWRQVLEEGREPSCGHNLVVHEFAHELDMFTGDATGIPPLPTHAERVRWWQVMMKAFQDHKARLDRGEATFFSEQAGEAEYEFRLDADQAFDQGGNIGMQLNSAPLVEFFTDACEAFYTVPHDLEAETPAVFDLLRGYFRVDPRGWFPE